MWSKRSAGHPNRLSAPGSRFDIRLRAQDAPARGGSRRQPDRRTIDEASLDFDVVNAGVSGDTSAGGLRRLDRALQGDVRVLIVALGGNDGLRGLAPDDLHDNLRTIIERAQARDIAVVLAGMEAPPNLGRDYTRAFREVYPSLAREYDVALVPFLLEDVAGNLSLNQRDGIHPNVEGTRIVAEHVWAVVGPLLENGDGAASERPRRTSSGS
jgi:acyl-CoA thioesterase-1